MQRRDPARTGYAPPSAGPSDRPTVRWRAALADDSTHTWLVAASGTVYAASDRAIYAFDAATGDLDWRTSRLATVPWSDERVWVETPPVVADDRLLVGSSISLYALDRTTGRPEWQYSTNSSLRRALRVGNTVYVSSLVGTDDRLVAVDARTGLERWRTPPETGVHPSACSAEYVVGPVVGADGSFGAVNAASGETEWTRDLAADGNARTGPCIANETVYLGSGPLYALDLADGTTRWSAPLPTADVDAEPVTDGERIYLAVGEADRVLALDADTGEAAWSVGVAGVADGGAPAIAGQTLYVGLERGVVALDASSGEERFRVRRPETANAANSPVAVGGTLYVSLGRTVYALEDP